MWLVQRTVRLVDKRVDQTVTVPRTPPPPAGPPGGNGGRRRPSHSPAVAGTGDNTLGPCQSHQVFWRTSDQLFYTLGNGACQEVGEELCELLYEDARFIGVIKKTQPVRFAPLCKRHGNKYRRLRWEHVCNSPGCTRIRASQEDPQAPDPGPSLAVLCGPHQDLARQEAAQLRGEGRLPESSRTDPQCGFQGGPGKAREECRSGRQGQRDVGT